MYKKKRKTKSKAVTPEQKRNAQIFRLRGFYSNAKTLPFENREIRVILGLVDNALERLDAQTQTDYMLSKKSV